MMFCDFGTDYSHSNPRWQICAVGIFRREQVKDAVLAYDAELLCLGV